ncbi:hypothetical protein B0H10DRAFT_1786051 [Mycena sp. CBHHK59/15]|nr:hypothetical protein B0H10DRAFT_1786051 [Mycena sp. CBHHK59/15]
MSASLHVKFVVLNDVPRTKGLPIPKLTANCYTPAASDPRGMTLLCAHGAGTHKEQWEPTLEQVFLKLKAQNLESRIHEVWAVNWQCHGAGAIINETALKNRPGVLVVEWAEAIAAIVRSPYLCGHRIVAIGHSAGSSAVVLATQYFPLRGLPFAAMIIVEPVMCSTAFYCENGEERDSAFSTAIMIVNARRTTWPIRDDAFSSMRKFFIWKGWDPRILPAYIKHGMKDLLSNNGVMIVTRNEPTFYPTWRR